MFNRCVSMDNDHVSVQMHLERTFRNLVEAIRSKRSNLPPEAQTDLTGKSTALEYYETYLVDRHGDEIASLNVGALQQGWLIPEYEQVYRIALPDSEQHASLQRARRPKPSCFNCGSFDHGVQGCQMKLDSDRVRRSREQYQEQMAEACGYNDVLPNNGFGNSHEPTSRYHEDSYQSSLNNQIVIEERFRHFQPGYVGYDLRQALGLQENQLPMYIYNMRRCGYPPGWLREARVKKSGLQVFHDNEEGT
jgi:zinc finger CCHC domain-containing protein 8